MIEEQLTHTGTHSYVCRCGAVVSVYTHGAVHVCPLEILDRLKAIEELLNRLVGNGRDA